MAITLQSPITITPPAVTTDGVTKTFPDVTLSSIDYSVYYDNGNQIASAMLKKVNRPVTLWSKNTTPSYSSVGQWTDADVDARLAEILGSNPQEYIQGLFSPVVKK